MFFIYFFLFDANCKSHSYTFKYDIIDVKPGTAHFRNVFILFDQDL